LAGVVGYETIASPSGASWRLSDTVSKILNLLRSKHDFEVGVDPGNPFPFPFLAGSLAFLRRPPSSHTAVLPAV